MDFDHLLFSPDGRISRGPFWTGLAILVAASVVLNLSFAPLLGISQQELFFGSRSPALAWLDLAVDLLLFWPGYVVTLKRLHDRNRGASLAILLYGLYFVAVLLQLPGLDDNADAPDGSFLLIGLALFALVLFLLVELGLRRGDIDANAYGPAPRPLPGSH